MGKYNYTPTTWVGGKTVGTADVMNNIENGIKNAYDVINTLDESSFDNQSISTSKKRGYKELPGGLIIQWGTEENISINNGDTLAYNVKFPLKFPNTCMAVACNIDTVDEGHSGLEVKYVVRAIRKDQVGIVLQGKNFTDTKYGTYMAVSWIAIGC